MKLYVRVRSFSYARDYINCLSYNANSNPNENNAILQNQPSEKPETKIQNNIVNTQDFRSDVLQADSVVTIQSENSYQTVKATKPQSRCSYAEKSVEGVSNLKLLNSSSQHTQTSKTQITDRKPKQSSSKSTHLKSCASKSKFQHQWINRLPLIALSYAEAFWHFWYFFVGQTILAGGKRAENGRAG